MKNVLGLSASLAMLLLALGLASRPGTVEADPDLDASTLVVRLDETVRRGEPLTEWTEGDVTFRVIPVPAPEGDAPAEFLLEATHRGSAPVSIEVAGTAVRGTGSPMSRVMSPEASGRVPSFVVALAPGESGCWRLPVESARFEPLQAAAPTWPLRVLLVSTGGGEPRLVYDRFRDPATAGAIR